MIKIYQDNSGYWHLIEIYQDNSGYWHFHVNGHTSNQFFSYQEAEAALEAFMLNDMQNILTQFLQDIENV
jgi:hypothetical protein